MVQSVLFAIIFAAAYKFIADKVLSSEKHRTIKELILLMTGVLVICVGSFFVPNMLISAAIYSMATMYMMLSGNFTRMLDEQDRAARK